MRLTPDQVLDELRTVPLRPLLCGDGRAGLAVQVLVGRYRAGQGAVVPAERIDCEPDPEAAGVRRADAWD